MPTAEVLCLRGVVMGSLREGTFGFFKQTPTHVAEYSVVHFELLYICTYFG